MKLLRVREELMWGFWWRIRWAWWSCAQILRGIKWILVVLWDLGENEEWHDELCVKFQAIFRREIGDLVKRGEVVSYGRRLAVERNNSPFPLTLTPTPPHHQPRSSASSTSTQHSSLPPLRSLPRFLLCAFIPHPHSKPLLSSLSLKGFQVRNEEVTWGYYGNIPTHFINLTWVSNLDRISGQIWLRVI